MKTFHPIVPEKLTEDFPEWADYAIAECPMGWYFIVYVMFSKIKYLLEEKHISKFEISQIKQKFHELRFYYRGEGQDIANDIFDLEDQADKICLTCGSVRPQKVRRVYECDFCKEEI